MLEAERNEFQRLLAEKAEALLPTDEGNARWGFIHIPKTGGTSVTETLQRVSFDNVRKASPWELASFPEVFEDTPVIVGHIPFHFEFRWERRPRTLATVLRDPVDRVVSFYRYVLATPEHHAHAFIQRFHPTLADCYDHPSTCAPRSLISRQKCWDGQRGVIRLSRTWAYKFATFCSERVEFYYCPADAGTLTTAQRRLQTDIQFACLARRRQRALCSRIAGNPVSALDTENRTPPVPWTPTEYDLEVVAAHNTLDTALYDFAVDLIDRANTCVG